MGAGEDAEVTTVQPSVNSSRVNNSVQFSDLRFMVFVRTVLRICISPVQYRGKVIELFIFKNMFLF